MGRRVFAATIAAFSMIHMGVIALGIALGWFDAHAGSPLLLAGAFLLALMALVGSLWAMRALDLHGFARAATAWLECRECGRPQDHDHAFCPGCGARS